MKQSIQTFLESPAFAVAGASNNRQKFGNKVLRCYQQHNKRVFPVNPNESVIEGLNSVPQLADLPAEVESLSIITPPPITEKIVKQAIAKGIRNIWIQPGAENAAAIEECKQHGINIIAGGPCILVQLGFHEDH